MHNHTVSDLLFSLRFFIHAFLSFNAFRSAVSTSFSSTAQVLLNHSPSSIYIYSTFSANVLTPLLTTNFYFPSWYQRFLTRLLDLRLNDVTAIVSS